MRDIQIINYCDACWADGEQKVMATGSFVIGIIASESARPRLRVLLSCERHAKPINDLAELIALHGEDVGAEPAPKLRGTTSPQPRKSLPDPGVCPVCGATLDYLSVHLAGAHGETVDALCLRDKAGRWQCPSCSASHASKHAMSVHHNQKHGRRVLHVLVEQKYARKTRKARTP